MRLVGHHAADQRERDSRLPNSTGSRFPLGETHGLGWAATTTGSPPYDRSPAAAPADDDGRLGKVVADRRTTTAAIAAMSRPGPVRGQGP